MIKRHYKRIVCVVMALIFVMALSVVPVSAGATDQYTHWDIVNGTKETVYTKDMYTATREITATTLGLPKKLSGITDLYCTQDRNTYLLCGEDSKLFLLDIHYALVSEIHIRDNEGNLLDFTDAQGIFVDTDGTIYLADTNNSRVLITDSTGLVLEQLTLPDSPIIPDNFSFQPTKVLKDDRGYIYVLSLGSYYGTILYSPKREFLGFWGANTVKATVLDTLSRIWELLTGTEEKDSQQQRALPFTIVDLTLDAEGYVYTCTGSTEGSLGSGQIQKLSPGGSNILSKRNFDGTATASSGYNFLETTVVKRMGVDRVQNLVAIDVSESMNIYALDSEYGKVYVYDKDCNMLVAFGGGLNQNNQAGTFKRATALAVNGNQVLVGDSKLNSITVFDLTDYGKSLVAALELYNDGEYVAAKPFWNKVLAQDGNNRLAYRGLAQASYAEGDLDAALVYAQAGMDYVTYDQAHQAEITTFIKQNFFWLFGGLILLLIGLTAFLIYVRKRETALIRNVKVHTSISTVIHPFQSFDDIKYKSQGSMLIATILLGLFFVATALKYTSSGYLFNQNDTSTYSVVYTLAQTVGLIVLWTIANWAVCTIFSGKGIIKEVYIVTCYSLTPLVVYNLVYTALSHVLSLDSVTIVNSISTYVLLFVLFLLCVGMTTIHEYSFAKFLITSVVSILFMILIVFIIFLVVILMQQFGTFIYSLFMEVAYR